jgi:hypothetical protein
LEYGCSESPYRQLWTTFRLGRRPPPLSSPHPPGDSPRTGTYTRVDCIQSAMDLPGPPNTGGWRHRPMFTTTQMNTGRGDNSRSEVVRANTRSMSATYHTQVPGTGSKVQARQVVKKLPHGISWAELASQPHPRRSTCRAARARRVNRKKHKAGRTQDREKRHERRPRVREKRHATHKHGRQGPQQTKEDQGANKGAPRGSKGKAEGAQDKAQISWRLRANHNTPPRVQHEAVQDW